MYGEERPYEVIPDGGGPEGRRRAWETASGLQATDGLAVSGFAHDAGERYIDGEYDSLGLQRRLESRYGEDRSRQAEADIVSGRIVTLLESATVSPFRCTPDTLRMIHHSLFHGVLEDGWVGRWREENIAKAEPVLGGRSVDYHDWRRIPALLDFDFGEESRYRYTDIGSEADIGHMARFISGIWEIHPFREGNTRTVAVFAQQYLATFGVQPGNDVFRDSSAWFRDALARAAYSRIADGVDAEPRYIEMFFENLVGAGHDLGSVDMSLAIGGDAPLRREGSLEMPPRRVPGGDAGRAPGRKR